MQEYSLGFQYEFAHRWVLDVGYVGSKGINLTDYNHNHNGAQLVTPANDQHLHTDAVRCQPQDGLPTGLQHVQQCLVPGSGFWATSRSVCRIGFQRKFELQQPASNGAAPVRPRAYHAGSLYVGQEPLRRLLRQLGEHQRRSRPQNQARPEWATTRAVGSGLVRSVPAARGELQLRPAVRQGHVRYRR